MSHIPVGIWIRVSTQMQVADDSPAHHEFRARAYAQAQGWTVVALYDLAGVSGKDVWDHPETQRMLADIRTKKIKGLVFSKLARLARNTEQLLRFANFFAEHDARLVSLSEALDPSTPIGKMVFTFMAGLANWERDEIAARVKESVKARASLGRPLGGSAPYGYQWADKKLELHPEEAPVRKYMYELYLKYRRLKAVARILNAEGYRTRKGNKFTHSNLKLLLRDPVAKGLRRTNYTGMHSTGKWVYKPEAEWIYVSAPAIVDEATWDACQGILYDSEQKMRHKGRYPVNLFSGIVVCESCRIKMYLPFEGCSYRCSACNRKLAHPLLEALFLQLLGRFVGSPQQIHAERRRADGPLAEYRSELEDKDAQQARVEEQKDRLYQLFQAQHVSGLEFEDRNTPMFEEQLLLKDQTQALRSAIMLIEDALARSEGIVQATQSMLDQWPSLTKVDKRAAVESIVDEIVVGDKETVLVLDLHHKTLTSGQLIAKRQCNRREYSPSAAGPL